jgi:hypothetical protein
MTGSVCNNRVVFVHSLSTLSIQMMQECASEPSINRLTAGNVIWVGRASRVVLVRVPGFACH